MLEENARNKRTFHLALMAGVGGSTCDGKTGYRGCVVNVGDGEYGVIMGLVIVAAECRCLPSGEQQVLVGYATITGID
jgi:hypothetical protein